MVLQYKECIYTLYVTGTWKNRPFTIWDSKDLINRETTQYTTVQ